MTTYALAHDLIGFRSSTLRVAVTERRDGHVWVRTADLRDAGTPLVLRESQVTPLDETEPVGYMHRDGLVIFGA